MLAAPTVLRAQSPNGVALVIGNAKYHWEAALPNVVRDTREVATRLRALGLQTSLVENVGRDAMKEAIDKFLSAIRGANLAALYFAGHGVWWKAFTHLVPVDLDLGNQSAFDGLIRAQTIIDGMTGAAAHSLIILDNCRNSPFEGWRRQEAFDTAGGFSATQPIGPPVTPNSLALQSTAAGRFALDGPASGISPFAAVLLRHLERHPVDLQLLPAQVRRDLLITTQGRQFLWERNGFEQSFLIGQASRSAAASTATKGAGPEASGIIELTNAYAFAQQHRLPLPRGLIAYRPVDGTADSTKIGAFKFVGDESTQSLLIVLWVEGTNADVVLVTRLGRARYSWRLIRATVSGSSIEMVPFGGAPTYAFRWRDANSGSLTANRNWSGSASAPPFHGSFSRLDG